MLIKKSEQNLSELLSDKQAQALVVQLVKKSREHPEVRRGGSVRASLAVMEIARGYRCIRGKLTRNTIKDAAMLALPARITLRPESNKTPEYIVLEIIQEIVFETQSLEYGDPFKKDKPPIGKDQAAEFTKELMGFQEQQYRGKTRLKNLHAEFVRKKGKGENVEPDNLDYSLLEKKMRDLEAEGIVKFDEIGDGYQLQAPAIIFLLKNILKKDLSKTVKSTRKETATEKTSVRKYMKGDTYRMMSPRHTLRRMIRKGKDVDEISVDDNRCFEKASITGKDIAVCMDVSESMKEGLKLCYAKLAAAGVAKTAAANKDRVCIVSFSNTADTVCPLSSDLYKISQALLGVQTGKYTNAADAVKTAKTAKKTNTMLVVDNTFSTPYHQQPLSLGADLVIHSATKGLGGHNDLMAGVIACPTKEAYDALWFTRQAIGTTLDAYSASLLERGLKTFTMRAEKMASNAQAIAESFQGNSKISRLVYPGLSDDIGHAVAKKQMAHGFGGLMAFDVGDCIEDAMKFISSLDLVYHAVSLGATETMACIPYLTTMLYLPEERRLTFGVNKNTVRLSAGIEAPEDLKPYFTFICFPEFLQPFYVFFKVKGVKRPVYFLESRI